MMTPDELRAILDRVDTMDSAEKSIVIKELISQCLEQASVIDFQNASSKELTLQFQEAAAQRDGFGEDNKILRQSLAEAHEQISQLRQALFGRSSEKTTEQAASEDLSEMPSDPLDESSTDDVQLPAPVPETKRHKGGSNKRGTRELDTSRLPKYTVCEEPDTAAYNEKYGRNGWYVLSYEEHRELVHFRELYALKIIKTPVIYVKQDSCDMDHEIVRQLWKEPLYSGSLASPSIAADFMHKKYVLFQPFYRQAQELARKGLPLSRQTMTNWVNNIAIRVLRIVYMYMCSELCRQGHIQNDETTAKVIDDGRKAGSTSYIWVHVTSELDHDAHTIAVYCYELTRGTDHLRKFFNDGGERVFTCDAYASYQTFKRESDGKITTTGCWMHCRRKFYSALQILQQSLKFKTQQVGGQPGAASDALTGSPEYKAVDLIGKIYKADEPLKKVSPDIRKACRDKDVKPKVDDFFSYIHSLDPETPTYSSSLSKAISYALNQETELRQFLEDPFVPIDNGNCERAARGVAMLRQSSQFFFSITGAEAGAMIMTITETAKRNGADPYYYLKYLLEELPSRLTPPSEDVSYLKDLMPWSESYKTYESEQKKADIDFRCNCQLELPPALAEGLQGAESPPGKAA
ncbi:MAG: IS66 family transposase [Oscillospiraceae bacterium]|nr:IS66 family transposase [Oscillospiraceae bacterium]